MAFVGSGRRCLPEAGWNVESDKIWLGRKLWRIRREENYPDRGAFCYLEEEEGGRRRKCLRVVAHSAPPSVGNEQTKDAEDGG